MRISVIIPTLGGENLDKTISYLNNSIIIPDEIIICIPEKFSEKLVINSTKDNIKILKTNVMGQVAQRAEGFKVAKYEYILQLDDDVLIDKNCISELYAIIKNSNKLAISPKIYNQNGSYHSPRVKNKRETFYQKFIFWLINGNRGFEAGKISKNGIAMGLPDTNDDYEVEWLSGACVMHRKENLITHNFYPYQGKAYSEDIIHSIIMRKKRIKLIRSGRATCKVNLSSGIDTKSILKEFYSVLRIGLHIVENKRNYLYYVIYHIVIYISKVTILFKNK